MVHQKIDMNQRILGCLTAVSLLLSLNACTKEDSSAAEEPVSETEQVTGVFRPEDKEVLLNLCPNNYTGRAEELVDNYLNS